MATIFIFSTFLVFKALNQLNFVEKSPIPDSAHTLQQLISRHYTRVLSSDQEVKPYAHKPQIGSKNWQNCGNFGVEEIEGKDQVNKVTKECDQCQSFMFFIFMDSFHALKVSPTF
jgi:hypothetical protein